MTIEPMNDAKGSTGRVERALRSAGIEPRIARMTQSTRTAAEAARACGCEVGQIVKSLVFRGARSGKAVLILAAGDRRVNEESAAQAIGEPIERADPRYVREVTGFAIGGVAPIGQLEPIETWMDAHLLGFDSVWAAAGAPNAVFTVSPLALERATGARPLLGLANASPP